MPQNQNTYFPGQSVTCTADLSVFVPGGNPTPEAPASLTLYVIDSAGTETTYPNGLTPDAPGLYHQTFTLPSTPAFGRWQYYWTAVGTQMNQNGVSTPQYFYVEPLPT